MKFKTKDDLLELLKEVSKMSKTDKLYDAGYSLGYTTCAELSFQFFSERIEFYKRYKSNWIRFSTEHKEEFDVLYQKWENKYGFKRLSECLDYLFENWLFDYCFKDGLK